jgi:hypothetical protein
MDDRSSALPLTIKSALGRDTSDATISQSKFAHYQAQTADEPKPVFPPPPWQEVQVKPERTKGNQK